MKVIVNSSEFVRSYPNTQNIDWLGNPEVLVVGRSNVGKSTLINRLCARKKLALVSGKPGKTRLYNLYKVFLNIQNEDEGIFQVERQGVHKVTLLDVPGFGYAKFSQKERAEVSKQIVNLLSSREELSAVCLLQDSKREPQQDEITIRNICAIEGIPILVVLTKIDRLNKKERQKQIRLISDSYGLEPEDLILTGEKIPIFKLWQRIAMAILS